MDTNANFKEDSFQMDVDMEESAAAIEWSDPMTLREFDKDYWRPFDSYEMEQLVFSFQHLRINSMNYDSFEENVEFCSTFQ
jgi:hypothetical protein